MTVRDVTIVMEELGDCGGTAPFFYPSNQGNTSARIDGLLVQGGGYPFRLAMPGSVRGLKIVDRSWGYGPIDVRCSVLSSWGAAIVTITADYKVASTVPIATLQHRRLRQHGDVQMRISRVRFGVSQHLGDPWKTAAPEEPAGAVVRRMSAAAMPPSDRKMPKVRNVCPTATTPKRRCKLPCQYRSPEEGEHTDAKSAHGIDCGAAYSAATNLLPAEVLFTLLPVALTSGSSVLSREAPGPRRSPFVLDGQ